MRRLVRVAGLGLVGLTALAVLLAATGWLYVVHPRLALGPPLPNALPLDELSKRSTAPVLVFVAVWGVAGLLLGLLARLVGVERLAAALFLALGVGSWTFLTTGVSILVVRQIPALEAFHAAGRMPAVYLPAALAGLGGAVAGRGRGRTWALAPSLLAVAVALAGVTDMFVAAFPEAERGLLEEWAPHAVKGVAAALVAPLGLGLVVIARGLFRRKHRAWQLAVALLGGSAALHLLHRIDYGATATALVALALVARRQDFPLRGDPQRESRVLLRAIAFASGIFGYGAAALWVHRALADQPYSAGFALRETAAALLGLRLRGSEHLCGRLRQLVPALGLAPRPGLRGRRARRLAWTLALPAAAGVGRARDRAGTRGSLGRRHARTLRAARRQVVLLQRGRAGVPRVQSGRRRGDRLGRSRRPRAGAR